MTALRSLGPGVVGGLLVALMLGLGLAMIAWRGPESALAPAEPMPVAVGTAQLTQGIRIERRYVGTVVAPRMSEMAFELPGLVLAVTVDDGDRVAAGDALARLDTDRLETRRMEIRAQIAELEANLELARLTEARQRELFDKGHVSAQRYDEARLSRQALAAGLQQAQAALRAVEVDLEKAVLRAPYAALVTHRLIDEGAVVAAGQPALRLEEAGRREARIGVPVEIAADLKPGSSQDLVGPAGPTAATVRQIVPSLDPATRTVTVIFDVQDSRLPSGSVVRLAAERPLDKDGFWVPLSALTEGVRGLWSLYVLKSEGDGYVAARRDVEVLHSETDRAFVRGTLEAGDRFVSDGVHRIVPGQAVVPAAAVMAQR